MKKTSETRTVKSIMINDLEIVSDLPTNSQNIIKIKDEFAVIYAKNGDHLAILKKDLDDFILDHTWGFYGDNFANTKISTSQLLRTCEKYNLDLEAFGLTLDEIDDLGKQQIVSIHRYVMGFYNAEKRKEYKEKYEGVLADYGLESIDQLVVDHDMNNSRGIGQKRNYNYSDRMRIVPQKVNNQLRVGEAQRHKQSIYPITKEEQTGQFQLEIKEIPSPIEKTKAVIIDNNMLGLNVQHLQSEILKKHQDYIIKLLFYYRDNQNITPFEKLNYKRQWAADLLNELIPMVKKSEEQGKVKIEWY